VERGILDTKFRPLIPRGSSWKVSWVSYQCVWDLLFATI